MTSPTPQQEPQPLADLAAWLVYWHQLDQEALAGATATGLALLWSMLEVADLDKNKYAWLHSVTLQVEKAYRASEKLAYEMAQGVRWAWVPDADQLPLVETVFPESDVQLAARVTGPIKVKQAIGSATVEAGGDPSRTAMALGETGSTGAGVKYAMQGGRNQVLEFVDLDRKSSPVRSKATVGYARVTDSDPCSFCALLASQGAVYLSQDAFDRSNSKIRESNKWRKERRAFIGDGVAKVHDNCQCSVRPVFSTKDSHDDRANFFLDQWEALNTDGLGFKDQIKEFRRHYIPPEPYKVPPPVDVWPLRENHRLLKDGLGADAPQVKFLEKQIRVLAEI